MLLKSQGRYPVVVDELANGIAGEDVLHDKTRAASWIGLVTTKCVKVFVNGREVTPKPEAFTGRYLYEVRDKVVTAEKTYGGIESVIIEAPTEYFIEWNSYIGPGSRGY